MGRLLNAGIIGLGEVAQVIHLPVLELFPDKYRIAALCDISPKLLTYMGEKYKVNHLYTDARELVKQADLDVVFILGSDEYHAEFAIAAADQKKHVFIEKPMSLSDAEADKIIAARQRNDVKMMVGYMRRFASAFTMALEEIGGIENIQHVRVRDILGFNHLFVSQVHRVAVFNDIPEGLWKERQDRAALLVKEAVGEELQASYTGLYRMLCGLSSHDLSAMREILGMPEGVIGAKLANNGQFFLNAIFDYDRFSVAFETGQDNQARVDAHIEVYTNTKSVRVQYDSSYIRGLPVKLYIAETIGDQYTETIVRPTLQDPYMQQLQQWYEVIVNDKEIKTTPEDFKQDLKIFRMLMDAVKKTDGNLRDK